MSILRNIYHIILKLKNNKEYESLAPISNIKKNATLNMLINAVGDLKNQNIALSGKYGAGKSSIIRSFFKGIRRIIYKPLYISLGMLSLDEKNINVNEFCQEIEKSIIQQIIYKENTSRLPDSNIKRVSKVRTKSILYWAIAIIILIGIKISSLYIKNYDERIKLLLDKYLLLDLWWKVAIIIISIIIITFMSKFIAKFFKKIDIKNIKFNFSNTEISIEKRSTESLINKYMDELVYFFSMTKYNVVIIEDLDRFLKNDEVKDRVLIIFQKLKELNQVLNSSRQVKRKITCIYVVKDDLFKDEEERTKFFDAIVPVIPIMSNYNSYAELKERFERFNINDKIMQDISPYINDYRVIKNLKNEYELYQKEITGPEIIKEKQLAMLVLKNLRPREYEDLLNNRGVIYNIFNKKEEFISKKESEINNSINENNLKINEHRKEKITDFNELKRIAISSLYGKNSNRYLSGAFSAEQFLNSGMDFNKIKRTNISINDNRGCGFTESEVFEYFGGKDNFLERATSIARKPQIEIERLTIENQKLEKEKDKLEKKPFYELFSDIENKETNDNLIKMLLTNGYIDESYQDYMFKYKETKEINKNDYTYISNVRQHLRSKYDYPIKNVEKVIEQLNENYFGTEPILNYNVVEFLIKSKDKEIKVKQDYCFDMLSDLNKDKENFILGFINYSENKNEFLTKLHNENENTIYEILINNSDNKDKMELVINNLLNIPDILTNEKTNNFIKDYIEKKKKVSEWIELDEKVKKSLVILNVKFMELEDNNNDFIEFIYNKNLYKVNLEMIRIIFKYKGFSEEKFEDKNLTIILHDDKLKELKEYIEGEKENYIRNCYLKTSGKQNAMEDVIQCLNDWDIDNELKKEIIKNFANKLDDIRDVREEYYEELIVSNKVRPTWENYYYFYQSKDEQINEELISNIELNIEEIINQRENSINISEKDKNQFNNFKTKIIMNNKIDIKTYKQIIPLFMISLKEIEENEIEEERLKILIENKKIEFNDNNLQVIYEQSPENIDKYISNNMELFINGITSYTINDNMICDIIYSDIIKNKEKNKIINSIDSSYINEDAMKYIINNYSPNKISKINDALKERIFKSKLNLDYKLTLFDKELDKEDSKEIIDKYIKLLPEPYKFIADYEKYPKGFSIPKTKVNEKILEKLTNMEFKFTPDIRKTSIIIHNKK